VLLTDFLLFIVAMIGAVARRWWRGASEDVGGLTALLAARNCRAHSPGASAAE
jgi:hypothetical protein